MSGNLREWTDYLLSVDAVYAQKVAKLMENSCSESGLMLKRRAVVALTKRRAAALTYKRLTSRTRPRLDDALPTSRDVPDFNPDDFEVFKADDSVFGKAFRGKGNEFTGSFLELDLELEIYRLSLNDRGRPQGDVLPPPPFR